MDFELEKSFARMGLKQSPPSLVSLASPAQDVTIVSIDSGEIKTSSMLLAKFVPNYADICKAERGLHGRGHKVYKINLPMRPLRWIIDAFSGIFMPIVLDADAELILNALAYLNANIDFAKLYAALFPAGPRPDDTARMLVVLRMQSHRIKSGIIGAYSIAAFSIEPNQFINQVIVTTQQYAYMRGLAIAGQPSIAAKIHNYDAMWCVHRCSMDTIKQMLDKWITGHTNAFLYANAFINVGKQLDTVGDHDAARRTNCIFGIEYANYLARAIVPH